VSYLAPHHTSLYLNILISILYTVGLYNNSSHIKIKRKLGKWLLPCSSESFVFRLVPKDLKIKIYKTVILFVWFCMGVKPNPSH
jgi:hypothetical protein